MQIAELEKEKIRTRQSTDLQQGRKDSNPRHLVLETNVLPTELHPYTVGHA